MRISSHLRNTENTLMAVVFNCFSFIVPSGVFLKPITGTVKETIQEKESSTRKAEMGEKLKSTCTYIYNEQY